MSAAYREWPGGWQHSSPAGPICPRCQSIHGADAVAAVGRFNPAGLSGYRSRHGGPLRASRAEAQIDACPANRRCKS